MDHRKFFVILISILTIFLICSCGKKEPATNIDTTPKTEKLVGSKELTDFSVDFVTGRHDRDDILPRVFDVWITETEIAQYQVESTTLTETDAKALVALVENDLQQIKEYTGSSPETKAVVIVVESDKFAKPLGTAYRVNNTAVISPELINENVHYSTLASAYLGTTVQWIGQGVCELLTNGVPEGKYLADYYNSGGNTEILGLFCARFDERLCGMKEASIAKATAASLVHYMVGSGADLTNPSDIGTIKQQWLTSIGANFTYLYPYEGEFSGFTIESSSNEAYDFILSSELAVYNIAWQTDKSCLMSSVHNLEYFLHRNNSGLLMLRDSIQADGSETMIGNTAKKLVYYIDEAGYQTNITMEGAMPSGEIYLPDTYSASHSSLHNAVYSYAGKASKKWLEVGLAEYYSALKLNDFEFMVEERNGFKNCDYRYLFMRDLVFNSDSFDRGDPSWGKSYYSDILEYYLSHGGSMASQTDFDPVMFYNASAFISLNSDKSKPYDYWLETCSLGVKFNISDEGSELDNYQCGSFVNYLVNNYSLSDVLTVYSDYSRFASVFGKSYDQLKSDWFSEITIF